MVWIIWNLNDSYSRQLSQKIMGRAAGLGKAERIPDYLACVGEPARRSSILLLNDMIAESKARHKKINAATLLRKYIWMPHGDLHARRWSVGDVKKYVEEHNAPIKRPMSISQLAKELKLTPKEREEIIIGKNLAYLSDYRDEVRRRTVYVARRMYEAVAKRFDVSYNDLMFYSTPETLALFNARRLPPQEIERRKGDAVCILKKGRFAVLAGSKASAIIKEVLGEEELHTEVKGLAASAGKVTGTAKIVRLDSEISKIKPGDIMVAVTTHPEYVPKMAIAAAVVTDEGGLTCHAAVICREMKKPCIVGTKSATKLIKDGDLVEVDADKGVVRKKPKDI